MKLTPKRHRSDSAKAAIQAAKSAALGALPPPSCISLRSADVPLWEAIVTARPRDTWTEADLVLAGQLARAYGDIAELQAYIDDNGMMVEGEVNPACALLDKTSRRALAMARQLKIDTISVVGKSRDLRDGSELERTARTGADDDDLIPRATH